MAGREFEAVIEEGRGGGALVVVPFDVPEVYGARRVPVRATFDGHPYRGSIVSMGGRFVLGIVKAIRAEIGKGIGDTVRVTVERDTGERRVEPPAELAAALAADPGAKKSFEALAYTHRREYAQWIAEAKKPETRERRAAKTVAALRRGEKR